MEEKGIQRQVILDRLNFMDQQYESLIKPIWLFEVIIEYEEEKTTAAEARAAITRRYDHSHPTLASEGKDYKQ